MVPTRSMTRTLAPFLLLALALATATPGRAHARELSDRELLAADRTAAGLDPELTAAYARALRAYQGGDLESGKREIEGVLERAPRCSEATNLNGLVIWAMARSGDRRGDAETALSWFRRAERLAPASSAAYVNQAAWHYERKQYAEVREIAERLLKNRANDPEGLLGIGIARYHDHELRAAEEVLLEARDGLDRIGSPRSEVARDFLMRARSRNRRLF